MVPRLRNSDLVVWTIERFLRQMSAQYFVNNTSKVIPFVFGWEKKSQLAFS